MKYWNFTEVAGWGKKIAAQRKWRIFFWKINWQGPQVHRPSCGLFLTPLTFSSFKYPKKSLKYSNEPRCTQGRVRLTCCAIWPFKTRKNQTNEWKQSKKKWKFRLGQRRKGRSFPSRNEGGWSGSAAGRWPNSPFHLLIPLHGQNLKVTN